MMKKTDFQANPVDAHVAFSSYSLSLMLASAVGGAPLCVCVCVCVWRDSASYFQYKGTWQSNSHDEQFRFSVKRPGWALHIPCRRFSLRVEVGRLGASLA